jgi:hypothetical protein
MASIQWQNVERKRAETWQRENVSTVRDIDGFGYADGHVA